MINNLFPHNKRCNRSSARHHRIHIKDNILTHIAQTQKEQMNLGNQIEKQGYQLVIRSTIKYIYSSPRNITEETILVTAGQHVQLKPFLIKNMCNLRKNLRTTTSIIK